MNRFKDAETLAATVREDIPRVAVQWLAAARDPLEKLTMAALDPALTDAGFISLVEEFSASLPGLLESMDHAALADLMESAMGAAMANGIASRSVGVSPTRPVKAKLPWETDAWLAGRGRYDEGKHKLDKSGKFSTKEGHEWKPADAEEAGMLSRLTGRKFQAGARIHATAEGVRHAEKGHKHQLAEKDWNQLKGRMFEQHTERSLTRTANNEEAIAFKFQRGTDRMEAIFTIHFLHKKAPGELRLKTYAQRG